MKTSYPTITVFCTALSTAVRSGIMRWDVKLSGITLSAMLASPSALAAEGNSAPSTADRLALTIAGQSMTAFSRTGTTEPTLSEIARAMSACSHSCRNETLAVLFRDRALVQAEGQRDHIAAMASYGRALQLDPTVRPTRGLSSERAQAAYLDARKTLGIEASIIPRQLLVIDRPSSVETNAALTLQGSVSGEVVAVEVWLRHKGDSTFSKLIMQAGERWSATWPCYEVGAAAGTIEYYVVAMGYDGETLAELGSPSVPLVIDLVKTVTSTTCERPQVTARVERIEHEKIAEHRVATPLPIYASSTDQMRQITLFYRPVNDTFHELPMTVMGGGFGALLSCQELGFSTGEVLYYFVGTAADGAMVELGSPMDPFSAKIVDDPNGAVASFPGQQPPASCIGEMDCPPDFPGCMGQVATRPKRETADVPTGWFGLALEADVLAIAGTDNACGPQSVRDFGCHAEDSAEVDPATVGLRDDGRGSLGGGFASGGQRVTVSYDRVLTSRLWLGVGVGFAFGGAPKASGGEFLPVHGETRISYLLRNSPAAALQPYIEVSGGIAQVDARVDTSIIAQQDSGHCDGNSSCVVDVQAWSRAGRGFGALGGGVRWAIGGRHIVSAGVRAMGLFPTSGFAGGAELGYAFGL